MLIDRSPSEQHFEDAEAFERAATLAREQELILAIQAGDASAFGALYELHSNTIFGYLTHLTDGNQDLAEELTQETFLNQWRGKLKGLEDLGQGARPWLHTAALNKFKDHYAHVRAKPPAIPLAPDRLEAVVGSTELSAERHALGAISLRETLDAVSSDQADSMKALALGFSGNESAQLLKISPGTHRKRVWQGRQVLQKIDRQASD